MKKLFSVGFLTSASMLLMTQNAYAGISITTESLWYVIPSAIIVCYSKCNHLHYLR